MFDVLKPGGDLAIADAVRAASPELAERYGRISRETRDGTAPDSAAMAELRQRGARSGGAEVRVEDYLRWLKRAGFSSVDCVWKRLGLAIVYGRKP